MQIPYLDITTAQSAGVSPFFGGVQMYWTAEAQTRTETEPQFKQMELKAWELSGYSVSSNVLLQDSIIGLEKFLMTLFAKSIAWFEEYAFLQGNGAGKPQGMLNGRRDPDRDARHGQPGQLRRRGDDVVEAAAVVVEQGHLGVLADRGAAAAAAQGRRQPGHLHQHRSGRDEIAQRGRCSAGRPFPARSCPPWAPRAI